MIIAHRGASGHRPEHTLAAYELGARMGADYIEPDLVPTRDGVLVARHENEISHTTDVASRPEFADRRAVKVIDGREYSGWFTEDFTLAELRTLRAGGSQEPVATFAEVLEIAQRLSSELGRPVGVYPETKHPTYFRALGLALEEPLIEALRGFELPVFVQSFEADSLRRVRDALDVPLVQLMRAPGDLAQIATYADAVGPAKRLVDEDFVRAAHAAGLAVHPYTFDDDPAEYERFFALGVDGVFSNYPDVAKRALTSRQSAS